MTDSKQVILKDVATGAYLYPEVVHQTIKQDGVTGATSNRYGACTTAAGTAGKEVALTAGDYSLEAGATVKVKFNNANTANSPTLKVGSTAAKNIFYKGAQITSGAEKGLLRDVCEFIYDGTQYHLVNKYAGEATDTSSKIFLIGATAQGKASDTYSHDTAFVDAAGTLNSATPAASLDPTTTANKTKVVTVEHEVGMITAICTLLDAESALETNAYTGGVAGSYKPYHLDKSYNSGANWNPVV